MGGQKTTFELIVNTDHLAFIRSAKEKYSLADESKAIRIVMDYLMTNPGIQDAIFGEVRCLRCE